MLHLDFETYSEVPIKDGLYKYVENCEVILCTYAFDDGEVQVWEPSRDPLMPADLADYLESDGLIQCHNTAFDRKVLKHALGIDVPIPQWRCTMARAYAHGLPGSLDKLSDIYKLGDQAKNKDGRRLIMLFCKPQKDKAGNLYRADHITHPEDWEKFVEYAKSDIRAMRKLDQLMPKWNQTPIEYEYWFLDQRSNDRGVLVDTELAKAALRAVDKEQARLKQATTDLTEGELTSTTQRDKTLEYILQTYGIALRDLTISTINRRLDDPDLPPEVKELLLLRLQASTTSTAKYKAMLKAQTADERIKGLIQFRGAMRTGRDAGRVVQPQNFPSRDLLPQELIDHAVDFLKLDAADLVFDNVMHATSSVLRATLIAAEGHKLVAADLSNIEGRYLAWSAEESWKVKAFEDYDAGIGSDLYVLAYARAFGIDPTKVTKPQRAVGKVMELALGYEGGVGAFFTFASAYNTDLTALAEVAYPTFPEDVLKEAHGFYEWALKEKRPTFGMTEKVFVTCDCFKRLWRQAHPQTVNLWHGIQDMVRIAIDSPGKVIKYGKFKAIRTGSWLRVIMPSGRALCYPFPRNDDGKISYMGVNQYTRKWERISTHGGKLVENCIAEGTEVLTDHGWVPIQEVRDDYHIWDGEEWCPHAGLKYSGKQFTISRFNVRMTPDHLVLTTEGWVDAQSSGRYSRYEGRLPSSSEVPRSQREKVSLGGQVRLREGRDSTGNGDEKTTQTRHNSLLRVYAQRDVSQTKNNPRDESPSGVCRLAEHVRPMPVAYSPRLLAIWRAGYSSVRRVAASVREFLEGYGSDISEGRHLRAKRQFQRVFSRELCVAHPASTSQQHSSERSPADTKRNHDREGGLVLLRNKVHNLTISPKQRLDDRESVRVYDILNCGPRHRFMVRGSDGVPLIVHNCVQAGSNDVFRHGALEADKDGYLLVFPVHDELVTEVPDTDEYSAEGLAEAMCRVPDWAKGLPLAAEGFESYRYRK